ncbi:hypothetical protein M3Y99_01977800 [Aphelenchoides fujianensis]|nr:hypothetical protein M3Y99_01977800 [Aphelenchoides fujianensis]
MRAAVRGGLNRFYLVDATETSGHENKEFVRLARLASISRAQLASVRRSVARIKFKHTSGYELLLRLNLGVGTPKPAFTVDQAKMVAIIRLLGVPVHLRFYVDVDWKALESVGRYVNELTILHVSPAFSAFVNRVAPHLRVLHSGWPDLERLPPLELERARIYGRFDEFNDLHLHKIHRLDVSIGDLTSYSVQSDRVVSSKIKSLGFLVPLVFDWAAFPSDSIEAFARRFPALEDLHITCKYVVGTERLYPFPMVEFQKDIPDLSAYFTKLWAKCLEIRDRLHVAGLKRLFVTIKHNCHFHGRPNDWFEKLELVEPFHEASSTIDRPNKCVRMFLKHNEPRGPKPTFVCIKGDFHWQLQENGEPIEALSDLSDGSSDDEMDDAGGG